MAWEYKTLRLTAPGANYSERKVEDVLAALDPLLNLAGAEGWELVGTLDTEAMGYTKFIVAIFKRPKQ